MPSESSYLYPKGTTPAGYAAGQSLDFLKRWGPAALASTLGAGGLAAYLTNKQERIGESKKDRVRRTLRNALLASGVTGAAWLGKAGYSGLQDLDDLDYDSKQVGMFDELPGFAPNIPGEYREVNASLFSDEPDKYQPIIRGAQAGTVGFLGGKLIQDRSNLLAGALQDAKDNWNTRTFTNKQIKKINKQPGGMAKYRADEIAADIKRTTGIDPQAFAHKVRPGKFKASYPSTISQATSLKRGLPTGLAALFGLVGAGAGNTDLYQ